MPASGRYLLGEPAFDPRGLRKLGGVEELGQREREQRRGVGGRGEQPALFDGDHGPRPCMRALPTAPAARRNTVDRPLAVKRYLFLASTYFGLVILANWLASRYVVSVGFGRVAPAGVFCIGGVLVLRDWLQQLRGLLWTMPLVYAAGLASWAIGDAAGWTSLEKIAVASVIAFTVSETVEAVVFTPLRRRNLTLGVALSATVGNALDSWLFLQLAFNSQAFFVGQFIGKGEMIALGTALTLWRRRLLAAVT